MRTLPSRDPAVSELVGALVLVAIVSLAIATVGVTILSGMNVSQVPAVSFSIENRSTNVTIIHAGGDSLLAGSYRILVDGIDRTQGFFPPPATTPFRTGTTLEYAGDAPPRTVAVVARGADGRETVLVQRYFP
ncbi:MAG: type IV pilin N-terminal domain-containing protein [Methanolinea sp.]